MYSVCPLLTIWYVRSKNIFNNIVCPLKVFPYIDDVCWLLSGLLDRRKASHTHTGGGNKSYLSILPLRLKLCSYFSPNVDAYLLCATRTHIIVKATRCCAVCSPPPRLYFNMHQNPFFYFCSFAFYVSDPQNSFSLSKSRRQGEIPLHFSCFRLVISKDTLHSPEKEEKK